jgi:hypothetical protein
MLNQAPAWEFTGSVFAVEDGNSYIAKMRLGASGDWLFRTPYSALPQRGVLAFLPYLLLGKLAGAKPAHLTLVLLYHGLRLAALPLAVLATYRFLARWLDSETWRRWATVLATLGGGLGWALLLLRSPNEAALVPPEFYSPEAFGFLAFFGIPHLLLARAALLLGLSAYLDAAGRQTWGWRAGFAWLSLVLIQPLAVASAAAALGAHALALIGRFPASEWRSGLSRWLKAGAPSLLLPAPVVLYLAAAYVRDPMLQAWARQNVLPSPPLWHYLLAYLPLLPLAGLGAWRVLRQSEGLLLATWPLALIALAYTPVAVQRRLLEGIWVALLALAALGLERLSGPQRASRWTRAALAAVMLPSTLLLLLGGWQIALHPAEPAFRPSAETAAFGWLADHASRGSVVLTSFATGNALPAWAPARVVIGHGPETADLEGLRPMVDAFFAAGTPDAARLMLLEDQQVDFVLFGSGGQAPGAWDPSGSAFLEPVYAGSGYALYAVR